MNVSVILRGREWDISYKIVEDDPSTNAFEIEWEIEGEEDAKVFGDASDEEEGVVYLAVCEAYRDYDWPDDYTRDTGIA